MTSFPLNCYQKNKATLNTITTTRHRGDSQGILGYDTWESPTGSRAHISHQYRTLAHTRVKTLPIDVTRWCWSTQWLHGRGVRDTAHAQIESKTRRAEPRMTFCRRLVIGGYRNKLHNCIHIHDSNNVEFGRWSCVCKHNYLDMLYLCF